ncbi:MAG: EI24 domain-containing protein [Desulfobacterales bacterium]|jgi:CysZ protein
MGFFKGFAYNLQGLRFGLKHPSLMLMGLVRFGVILVATALCALLVFTYYRDITAAVWQLPESAWLVWLWHLFSWLVALLLFGASALAAFVLSQVLFSVWIMDMMSRKTEQLLTGTEKNPVSMPAVRHFFYLLRQEVPRALLPVLVALLLMAGGWMTPLAPVTTLISTLMAAVFLAWDNTDLVPARRLEPFSDRFRFLVRSLPLHLGFGVWFLIPVLNVLFLSFAPVGATMVHIEKQQKAG